MTVTYHSKVEQGSEEWHALRCGRLTASEMKLIISPKPEVETRVKKNGELYKQREWNPVADNDKCRAHVYELLAQRITGYVEPSYISDDMLRGREDEILARDLYDKNYAPVEDVGFITNDRFGFTLGYSPDGLVGKHGLIEIKSRKQKYQVATIIDQLADPDYMIQLQTGLLVSERLWIDFISYSGGLPMVVARVLPDPEIQVAILKAAKAFETSLSEKMAAYEKRLETVKMIPTERRVELEMYA